MNAAGGGSGWPAGAEGLGDIWPVSRETLLRLDTYRRLLGQWQARTNLVAPGTLDRFWSRHVADSLQVLPLCPQALRFADLGSGGGFPGMVLAIANAGRDGARHDLIESVNKKCAFLRMVALETAVAADIHCERIESAAKQVALRNTAVEIVTARALAPLTRLLDLAYPLLAAGAVGIFHKGREYLAEIEECHGLWRYDLVVHPSRIEAGSVLLEIRNPVRVER